MSARQDDDRRMTEIWVATKQLKRKLVASGIGRSDFIEPKSDFEQLLVDGLYHGLERIVEKCAGLSFAITSARPPLTSSDSARTAFADFRRREDSFAGFRAAKGPGKSARAEAGSGAMPRGARGRRKKKARAPPPTKPSLLASTGKARFDGTKLMTFTYVCTCQQWSNRGLSKERSANG